MKSTSTESNVEDNNVVLSNTVTLSNTFDVTYDYQKSDKTYKSKNILTSVDWNKDNTVFDVYANTRLNRFTFDMNMKELMEARYLFKMSNSNAKLTLENSFIKSHQIVSSRIFDVSMGEVELGSTQVITDMNDEFSKVLQLKLGSNSKLTFDNFNMIKDNTKITETLYINSGGNEVYRTYEDYSEKVTKAQEIYNNLGSMVVSLTGKLYPVTQGDKDSQLQGLKDLYSNADNELSQYRKNSGKTLDYDKTELKDLSYNERLNILNPSLDKSALNTL